MRTAWKKRNWIRHQTLEASYSKKCLESCSFWMCQKFQATFFARQSLFSLLVFFGAVLCQSLQRLYDMFIGFCLCSFWIALLFFESAFFGKWYCTRNSSVLTIERTTKTGWNILYVPSSLAALPNFSLGRSLHRVWPTQLPLYRTKHRNSISISAQLLHLQEWVLAHAKNTSSRILFDSGDWS